MLNEVSKMEPASLYTYNKVDQTNENIDIFSHLIPLQALNSYKSGQNTWYLPFV